jgi:hypothetical protein
MADRTTTAKSRADRIGCFSRTAAIRRAIRRLYRSSPYS